MTALTRRVLLLGVAVLAARPSHADEVTLPDPASGRMVVRFDIGPDRGSEAPPLLEIMADGRFSVRAVQPGTVRVRGRLAVGELQALVDHIVTTEGLPVISAEEISARIDQISAEGGPMLMAADAPTTRLTLDLSGHRSTCRHLLRHRLCRPPVPAD